MHKRRRWDKLRLQILDRDSWRCQSCGKAGRLEVDHIIPLEHGGAAWSPDNLQALCVRCHIAKTRGERPPLPPERQAWDSLLAARLAEAQ